MGRYLHVLQPLLILVKSPLVFHSDAGRVVLNGAALFKRCLLAELYSRVDIICSGVHIRWWIGPDRRCCYDHLLRVRALHLEDGT